MDGDIRRMEEINERRRVGVSAFLDHPVDVDAQFMRGNFEGFTNAQNAKFSTL